MIYKMTLKDSADEMTFDLLEVPIVDKDIEGAVDNVTLDGNQYTDYLWLKKQFIQKWSILCDDEYTRLRGFYTRQFENADVPSYRLYYGDDVIRNSTLSGERIELSISGVADGTMSLTQMDGNIEQTTYTGKNLLQAKMPTTTLNGITCTNNGDGSYTLNGTATAGADFRINQSTAHGEDNLQNYDGTYTLSCDELQNDMQLIVMQNQTFSQILRMRNSNTPATATFTKNDCFIYIYVAQGKTLNNLRIHPMLEKSATATAYEPYVGGIPAPNPQFPQPIETVTGRQAVTIMGKNLYDPNSTVFSIPANVSVEVDGNSVKVTTLVNTTSNDLFWRTPIPDAMLENGKTYTISSVLGSGAYRSLKLQLRNHDGTYAGLSNGYTITYDSNYTMFVVENPFAPTTATQVTAGTTCTISNIQVEEGSTATTFESYNGQDYQINLTGKNMLDVSVGYRYGYIQSNGQYSDNSIIVLFNGFIPVEPSTTYTFSSNHANWNMTAVYYADMTTFIDRKLWSNTRTNVFTTPSNCHFVRLQVNYNDRPMNDEQVAGLELQLELGNQATAYEAYHSIKLCKIGNHQDRIYKENGKWYLHKEISCELYDGTESGWRSDAGRIEFVDSTIMLGSSSDNAVICDYYTTAWGEGTCIFISGTRRAVCILDPTNFGLSLATFKTWVANHNLTIAYALATPTDTEITNEVLVEELESLVNEAISVGLHNIYTDAPNALPTLTFDLTEYLSKSTTIIPETAVRLTLTDGGVINACGCRKDVQLTMRETIE